MYLQVKDKISAYVMSCLVVVSCSYSNSKKKKKKDLHFDPPKGFLGPALWPLVRLENDSPVLYKVTDT